MILEDTNFFSPLKSKHKWSTAMMTNLMLFKRKKGKEKKNVREEGEAC